MKISPLAVSATYLAKLIENIIEVDKNLTLCNFGNVVHCFAGVISDPRILVSKAS